MSAQTTGTSVEGDRISPRSRSSDLVRFYQALEQLKTGVGGTRKLSSCDGRMDWPTLGVYFFFEPGEPRADSGNGTRIVRVGTHALTSSSGTSLWNRLSQHRGVASTGGGNHRGSIFRLLVGAALMARDPGCGVSTWGEGGSAPRHFRTTEQELERRVSRTIGEMPFLWLRVDGSPGPESRRGYIERNACQRRLKIRPRGGAKDCHLGWWAELGVRLGFGGAFRGFFGGSGQRSHAELKRSAPAGRPQGGMVCRVGVSLATRALEARCRPGPIGGAPEFSYRRCFCGRGSG